MKKTLLFYSYHFKRLEDLIFFSKNFDAQFNILFVIPEHSYIPLLKKNKINYVCLHCINKNPFFSIKIPDALNKNRYISKFIIQSKYTSIGQMLQLTIRLMVPLMGLK